MSKRRSKESLAGKTARASVVVLFAQGGGLVLQLLSIVLLSRVLEPTDFGLFAMCVVVIGASEIFQNLGLSSATVQVNEISRQQQSNLFWVNVCMGGVLFCILFFFSSTIAILFNEVKLTRMLQVASPVIPLSAIAAQHAANLKREVKVGKLALIELISSTLSLLVALVSGLMGSGYWALIYGILARTLSRTLMLTYSSGFKPQLPCLKTDMQKMFVFGKDVTLYNILEYIHRNVDNYLIARFLGAGSLALYSRAYSLITVALRACKSVSFGVFFPILSRLKNSTEEYNQYYSNMARAVCVVAGLISALTFSMSEEIVSLALGDGWEAVSPILQLFSIVLFFQIIDLNRNVVLLSLGEGKRYARCGGLQALLSAIGIGCGLPWGILGVSLGYTLANALSFIVLFAWCMRGTPIHFGLTMRALALPSLVGVASSYTAIKVHSEFLKTETTIGSLIVKTLIITGIFLLLVLLHPAYRREVNSIMRNIQNRRNSL